jgi:chromosome segregation ATPase
MAALLMPSVQKFSVSKDSVSFEQFQTGVGASRDAIAELHKNSDENARAIQALRDSFTEMKSAYSNLITKQNEALAALAQKIPGQTGPTAAEASQLTQVQRDLQRSLEGINSKLDQADRAINTFNANNDVAQRKIRDIDAAIRQQKF